MTTDPRDAEPTVNPEPASSETGATLGYAVIANEVEFIGSVQSTQLKAVQLVDWCVHEDEMEGNPPSMYRVVEIRAVGGERRG